MTNKIKEINMKIQPAVAGLLLATSVFAVGTVQAQSACTRYHCPMQAEFSAVGQGFTGEGWRMVPCNYPLQRAQNWAQFASGTYAPPVVDRRDGLLFW
jgi:hypothetical protein